MIEKNISVIGAGHIGCALLEGLLKGRSILGERLMLANPHLGKLRKYQIKYKVKLTANNIQAARWADILIIAVRPKIVKSVASEIRKYIKKNKLIISTAACVTLDLLEKYFTSDQFKIVRIMPNIPVMYNMGVVGWAGNKRVGIKEKKLIENLLKTLGVVVECKSEEEFDRIGIISGCGPGISAYLIRSFGKTAEKYGFSEKEGRLMAHHVFAGTIHHLQHTNITTEDLITAVATKGGITEEVIKSLELGNFPKLLAKSFDRGYAKIEKITDELRQEV